MEELIITNGDSTVDLMHRAGFVTEAIAWRDVLHDGPVPHLPPKQLSEVRAAFLTTFASQSAREIAASMQDRDARLETAIDRRPITLWFEHDLYDQLQLIQILQRFNDRQIGDLGLVQADDFLGHMAPQTIGAMRPKRRSVRRAEIEYASAVWTAFTAPQPEDLNQFIGKPALLTHMPPAIRRLGEEFPDARTGLTLTQAQALRTLSEGGTADDCTAFPREPGNRDSCVHGRSQLCGRPP